MKYLLVILALLLQACGGGDPAATVTPDPLPIVTPVPVITHPPVPAPEPIPTPAAEKADALMIINAMRFFGSCNHGQYEGGPARVLVWSAKLEAAASSHVQTVVISGDLTNTNPAEILTHGYPTVRETAMEGLSAQDCAKLMNPAFKEIGLSSAQISPLSFDFRWSIMLGAGK